MHLGLINGSMTPIRNGFAITDWIQGVIDRHARAVGLDVRLDRIDLVDLALPFHAEPNLPFTGIYTLPHTQAWAARVAALDAFVFVTPEQNHSYNAMTKNALDYLYAEWQYKPAGLVTYGAGVSAGLRAGAHLQLVLSYLRVLVLEEAVTIPFVGSLVNAGRFQATPPIEAGAEAMLQALFRAEPALAAYRAGQRAA
jgi:NAD(P)H-dependent FMN reductase